MPLMQHDCTYREQGCINCSATGYGYTAGQPGLTKSCSVLEMGAHMMAAAAAREAKARVEAGSAAAGSVARAKEGSGSVVMGLKVAGCAAAAEEEAVSVMVAREVRAMEIAAQEAPARLAAASRAVVLMTAPAKE